MLFNTFTYAVFLVVVLLAYLRLGLRGRQIFLLVMSYIFYCWETPIYGTLLAHLHAAGLFLRARAGARGETLGAPPDPHGQHRRQPGPPGFFQVRRFLHREHRRAWAVCWAWMWRWQPMHIILPVGISFYTFQTMSYTIQLYRRQTPKPRGTSVAFALFVTFFPQLVAGPIERASHLLPQLLVYQQGDLGGYRRRPDAHCLRLVPQARDGRPLRHPRGCRLRQSRGLLHLHGLEFADGLLAADLLRFLPATRISPSGPRGFSAFTSSRTSAARCSPPPSRISGTAGISA